VEPTEAGDSLPETFWSVARALRHQSKLTLEPWEITPSQSRALGVLMRHGSMRLSDLAEHLRIAPRSATEVVDDLQSRGLASRLPDPDDRRATLVTLTDAGAATGEAIRGARRTETDRIFGVLSDDDREALNRILGQLRRAIEEDSH
jgi:DNA-binding MarR family transcriptional regulator